jgi:hypothetical protein
MQMAIEHEAARCRVEQLRVIVRPDGAIDRKGASIVLNKSPKTLANWTLSGLGPRSWLIGGRRHYDYAECCAFARGEAA